MAATLKKQREKSHSHRPSLSFCKNVCYIPLTQGRFAVIDAEDFPHISQYNWRCKLDGNTYYAYTTRSVKGRQRKIFMHRLILNAPRNKLVDHIDGNGLNNRKANLRLCNHKQNGWNRRPNSRGYSKYKGVSWHKGNKKWRAAIRKSYKLTHLGYFDSEIEAALAYDKKAKELFGEFAYLNFKKSPNVVVGDPNPQT